MLKPSYIFLWIVFHITAVELPKKIKKYGEPQIPVTEYVAQSRYLDAISHYSKIDKVKQKEEWYSLAYAFNRLGYVDTAERLMERMLNRFPKKVTAVDKLLYAELLRKKGIYQASDSFLKEVKASPEFAKSLLYSQYKDAGFLNVADQYAFLKMPLEHFRSKESNDIYGLVKSAFDGSWYYHERQPFNSGLMNNIVTADGKPYGRIKSIKELKDTIISDGTLLPKQLWNRHLELSDIDAFGNQYVTVNIPFVNDQDKFLLNVRRMYYDTGLSKIVFADLGFDRLAYNTSSLVVSPDGNRCVFVSDADGGFGKSDLWMGDLVYNTKGEPAVENFYNLGEQVNSIKSDFDPCFITDDIIVFSSDGHFGFGGRDLFAFHLSTGNLINLGSNMNTQYDEIAPRWIDGYLYFSSDRIENRLDFFRTPLNVAALQSLLAPSIHGDFVDTVTNNTGTYVSEAVKSRVESLREIRNRLKDSDPRKYNFTRGVDFLLADDSIREVLISEINENSEPQDFKFMTLNHPSGYIVIEEEFEKELILLAKTLNKRKDWAVIIRSHTDSRGSNTSNKKLSQERAGFLGDYLEFLKVNKKQIILEGLGEEYPLNHCFDGAPCTEEELSKNRRTELILVSQKNN